MQTETGASQAPTTTDAAGPVVAPAAEDLIRELREHHATMDPEDEVGFNSAEIWEYRLQTFGYVQLFSDWYVAIGAARGDRSAEPSTG